MVTRAEKLRLANLRRQQKRGTITFEDPAEAIRRKITGTSTAMQRIGLLAGAGIAGIGATALVKGIRAADVINYPLPYLAKGVAALAKERKGRISDRPQHGGGTAGVLPGAIGGRPLMGSSVVQFLEYWPIQLIVNVRLGLGRGRVRDYYYLRVPQEVFDSWWAGAATCQTSDTHSRQLWRAGDTPSLGAFFTQHIKGHFTFRRGTYRP